MRRKTTWWRNLGGLLVACVLALLVAAPTTSAAACLCNEDTIGKVTNSVSSQTIRTDQRDAEPPCKEACCLGGHCHHAGSALDASVVVVTEPAPKVAELTAATVRALISRTLSALDRPPRG